MKKLIFGIMAAAALLSAQPAMANDPDNYVYVPEDVVLDDQGQAQVKLWLKTDVTEFNSFSFNLYLPEGFTILKNTRGNYIFTWNTGEDVAPSHNMSYADKDGYISMLGTSVANEYLLPGDHWLFYFTIQAPEGFDSFAIGSFRDIEFAEGTVRKHVFDNVDFVIRTADVTGIEDVTVDLDGEDVIYNLQGIRVQAPLTSGFYIINGQKRHVK